MKNIQQTIKSSGGRFTKSKQTIVNILSQNGCLISKNKIIQELEKQGIRPDRSTLYRVLFFLTENNIILKNTINGTDYFEIQQKHHHHLVCINCKRIDKVEMENCLEKQEKRIALDKKFQIINHTLEFYGYCQKCQKTTYLH